jgi:uncharacterized protein DUF4293
MLQRMQSLWLLIAGACGILTFKYSFFSGNKLSADQTKTFQFLTATTNMLILVLTGALVSALLIDIFLYKNRKLQLRIVFASLLVSILNVYLYLKETNKFVGGEGNYDLTCVLTFAIPILIIMAAMGIYKDEKLVKSLDRLR